MNTMQISIQDLLNALAKAAKPEGTVPTLTDVTSFLQQQIKLKPEARISELQTLSEWKDLLTFYVKHANIDRKDQTKDDEKVEVVYKTLPFSLPNLGADTKLTEFMSTLLRSFVYSAFSTESLLASFKISQVEEIHAELSFSEKPADYPRLEDLRTRLLNQQKELADAKALKEAEKASRAMTSPPAAPSGSTEAASATPATPQDDASSTVQTEAAPSQALSPGEQRRKDAISAANVHNPKFSRYDAQVKFDEKAHKKAASAAPTDLQIPLADTDIIPTAGATTTAAAKPKPAPKAAQNARRPQPDSPIPTQKSSETQSAVKSPTQEARERRRLALQSEIEVLKQQEEARKAERARKAAAGQAPAVAADQAAAVAADQAAAVAADQTTAEAADQAPVAAADQTTAEAADQTPTEAADQTPTEAADQTPTEAADQTPTEAADPATAEATGQAPVAATGQPAAEAADQTTVEATSQPAAEAADQAAAEAADQAPAEAADQAPAEAADQAPVAAADQAAAKKAASSATSTANASSATPAPADSTAAIAAALAPADLTAASSAPSAGRKSNTEKKSTATKKSTGGSKSSKKSDAASTTTPAPAAQPAASSATPTPAATPAASSVATAAQTVAPVASTQASAVIENPFADIDLVLTSTPSTAPVQTPAASSAAPAPAAQPAASTSVPSVNPANENCPSAYLLNRLLDLRNTYKADQNSYRDRIPTVTKLVELAIQITNTSSTDELQKVDLLEHLITKAMDTIRREYLTGKNSHLANQLLEISDFIKTLKTGSGYPNIQLPLDNNTLRGKLDAFFADLVKEQFGGYVVVAGKTKPVKQAAYENIKARFLDANQPQAPEITTIEQRIGLLSEALLASSQAYNDAKAKAITANPDSLTSRRSWYLFGAAIQPFDGGQFGPKDAAVKSAFENLTKPITTTREIDKIVGPGWFAFVPNVHIPEVHVPGLRK
ncbi:MAG: hypothetical protein AB7I18_13335 [Candidatus Berkiella sp.]